ncbi:hypothetical protein [Endozoicomonas ascidiicola]|uniref:hypothetical protein n=1 Tax=Endozoicomonas ascidiicola TaxID=1698521 RepID=UPI00083013A9|nr:hypothetical protein [Endozoicomonas ascidiicola]
MRTESSYNFHRHLATSDYGSGSNSSGSSSSGSSPTDRSSSDEGITHRGRGVSPSDCESRRTRFAYSNRRGRKRDWYNSVREFSPARKRTAPSPTPELDSLLGNEEYIRARRLRTQGNFNLIEQKQLIHSLLAGMINLEPRETPSEPKYLRTHYEASIVKLQNEHYNDPSKNLARMLSGLTSVRNLTSKNINKKDTSHLKSYALMLIREADLRLAIGKSSECRDHSSVDNDNDVISNIERDTTFRIESDALLSQAEAHLKTCLKVGLKKPSTVFSILNQNSLETIGFILVLA